MSVIENIRDTSLGHRWAIVFGVVGVATLINGMHGFARIPGDLIDARFNQYVLEHFWRFITFREPDFWNAAFYYPYPLTIAFSSNHLGSAPLYSIFRLFGFDRDMAFQLWYVAGYLASFVSAYWVLARAGFGKAAAATGAFLFAFGLPALAQQNHSQLIWRCAVPLASWWLWGFLQTGKPRLLFLAALVAVWQLYCEIYMGVMLGMLLAAFAIGAAFAMPGGWRALLGGKGVAGIWTASTVRERAWLGGVALLAVLAIALLLPYVQVVRHYGFARSFDEVRTMLPQIRSYLLNDQSPFWGAVAGMIKDMPLRWEHQLFIGIGGVTAVAPAFLLRPPAPMEALVRACRVALIVLVIATINVHNLSLYDLIMRLPGLSAMRAVTRIIEVMLWPIAVLAATTLTILLAKRNKAGKPDRLAAVAVAAMVLIVSESALSRQFSVTKRYGREVVAALKDEIAAAPKPPGAPVIVAVATRSPGEINVAEVSAMLATQDLGLATMNGYSGNTPPGYGVVGSCLQVIQHVMDYVAVNKPPGADPYGAMIDRVLPIGFADCPPNWRALRPTMTRPDGPLDPAQFASLRLTLRNVQAVGDNLEADVIVTTTSKTLVPAAPNAPHPLRLSWRFVDTKAPFNREGFDTRKDLFFDILPGEENWRHITAPLPPAGAYQFEVSVVEENSGWLFDKGQAPARAPDIVVSDRK